MSWLGVDIGGANLKAADGHSWAGTVFFPLWRAPDGLTAALTALINSAPLAERLAVTMTGELCDCFGSKHAGVQHILSAVKEAAGRREISVYLIDGRLVPIEEAREVPHLAAASNWHALARFACRFVEGCPGIVVDIGSTTTDIVPLVGGQPGPNALDDTARLLAGELVYTGVGRTPVCAITPWLPLRGARCPVAAEVFATAADAYVLLGEIAEQLDAAWTADGRPLTKECAHARLARMICADVDSFDESDAKRAAESIRAAQIAQLRTAISRVVSGMAASPERVVISGTGEFLASRAIRDVLPTSECVSLAGRLGPAVGEIAPAHALAVIARASFPSAWSETAGPQGFTS